MSARIPPVHIFPSQIPAWGWESKAAFPAPHPAPKQAEIQNAWLAGGPGSAVFPFPPATRPTERQTQKLYSGQPLSARAFWRLTIQCFHCLSTNPSSTWLTDPKLPPSTTAPCPREEPEPSFSSSSTKMAPSLWVSIVNKNTRSRHRGSRWLMCQLPAQAGPAVPIETPNYRSFDVLSAPSCKPLALLALTPAPATVQSHSISFYAFGANCWQFFSLNPTADGFCLGLGKAFLACSLTHRYRASEINCP